MSAERSEKNKAADASKKPETDAAADKAKGAESGKATHRTGKPTNPFLSRNPPGNPSNRKPR